MSQITLLYNQYIENIDEPAEKRIAMEDLAEIIPAKEYSCFEERLTNAEDKMTEDAFKAGFRAALLLAKEALA